MGSLLFSFLCISNHGLRITDIQCLCGDLYDASDFSYLKKSLGSFIFEREDHRYDFTHKIFQGEFDISLDPILEKYFTYSSLSKTDPLSIPFVIHSSICTKKYSHLYDLMAEWSESPTEALKAAEHLAQFIEENVNVGTGLIEGYQVEKNDDRQITFITKYLIPFLSTSVASKKFIDGISNRIFPNNCDINAISESELKAICAFEKKRFEFNGQYSGRKTIETNRYFLCLKELAKRLSDEAYIINLENFRLDYEPYWDVLVRNITFLWKENM